MSDQKTISPAAPAPVVPLVIPKKELTDREKQLAKFIAQILVKKVVSSKNE